MSLVIEIVETAIGYAAIFAEAIAAVVIIVGAVHTLWIYLKSFIKCRDESRGLIGGRIRLGHSLVLGLEFLIAAAILKTAVSPQWKDIWQLAVIVGIRTVLDYFLTWELEKSEEDLNEME